MESGARIIQHFSLLVITERRFLKTKGFTAAIYVPVKGGTVLFSLSFGIGIELIFIPHTLAPM